MKLGTFYPKLTNNHAKFYLDGMKDEIAKWFEPCANVYQKCAVFRKNMTEFLLKGGVFTSQQVSDIVEQMIDDLHIRPV